MYTQQDNDVLGQFGDKLDSLLTKAGDEMMQIVLRNELHSLYEGMSLEQKQSVRARYGAHPAIKAGHIAFWESFFPQAGGKKNRDAGKLISSGGMLLYQRSTL